MVKKINGWLYWTPRILGILFLVFLSLFSLDIFEGGYGFWGTIVGLLMHNIPVFILAVVLWISWSYEIVGGTVFTLAGLAYAVMMWKNAAMYPEQPSIPASFLILSLPAWIVGGLFLTNWFKK